MKQTILLILGIILTTNSWATIQRNMDFLNDPKAAQIEIRKKVHKDQTDHVFVDGLGREVTLRGWNNSGMSKLPKFGFKPIPTEDADAFYDDFRKRTGPNIIRYLINWEATHQDVDKIDYKFLADTVVLLKKAIKRKMYILLDYHQDIFSRWVVVDGVAPRNAENGWDADGAPKWVIDGMDLPQDGRCGPPCVRWSINYFTNKATKKAFRMFWNNDFITTKNGKKRVQDLYFWQMEKVLTYIKANLTPEEFNYIIGMDPMNEPAEGGLRAYSPALTPHQWTNEKLWPFHLKTRELLNKTGYEKKLVFAEPPTFWNIGLFMITPRGDFKIDNAPLKGFVFNGHFYDEKRQLFTNINPGKNGVYLEEFEAFRRSARNINGPSFISEYGGWGDKRSRDSHRILKSIYQAMETTAPKESGKANFYSPVISGTQWDWYHSYWDYDEAKPLVYDETHVEALLERSYPRRIQGDLMHFYYNDAVRSRYKNKSLDWMGIQAGKQTLFAKNKFSLLVWKGRKSEAPTEVYLPRHFDKDKTLIITEKHVFYGKDIPTTATGNVDEVFMTRDYQGEGHRLFIFDDIEDSETYHFALAVELSPEEVNSKHLLKRIRKKILAQIKREHSPLRFLGKFKMDKPRRAKPHRVPFLLEGE